MLPFPLHAQETFKVKARVQMRSDGPVKEVEMAVYRMPVDPPSVPAQQAELQDDELVLGLVIGGQPMAYPIRYLALFEVVNDRVANRPIALSW